MSHTEAPAMEGVEQFAAQFERARIHLAKSSPAWLMELRELAMAEFLAKGFPTAKVEAWRQTNVAPVKRTEYNAPVQQHAAIEKNFLERIEAEAILDRAKSHRMVFVNGVFLPELSSDQLSDGRFTIGTIAQLLASEPEFAKAYLGAQARIEDSPFTALNTALFDDGPFVQIPNGCALEQPIYIVHVTTCDEPVALHPRTLIVAGESSEAKVFEHFIGFDEQTYLNNYVSEIHAGENSSIQHYKLQQESLEAFHIGTVSYRQNDDSNLKSFSLAFGGAIARTDIVAHLDGSGIDCTLNGLYLAQGTQHIDHHTRLEHAKQHCHSSEVYKGILDEQSTAVFVGLIHVHPDAQKTDAVQSSKCVLLSDTAHMDSQPQLKIFADDVKCTHGAAIGQLDEEAVFYLRSRGIDEEAARGLLTYAFGNDILERIRIEPLRERLHAIVSQRFYATEYAELE